MGRNSHDDAAEVRDWEDPLPVAPPGRAGSVVSAALPLAVIAGTRWAVRRLTSLAEQAGPFGLLADLDAMPGIGPTMMERLDRLVSW